MICLPTAGPANQSPKTNVFVFNDFQHKIRPRPHLPERRCESRSSQSARSNSSPSATPRRLYHVLRQDDLRTLTAAAMAVLKLWPTPVRMERQASAPLRPPSRRNAASSARTLHGGRKGHRRGGDRSDGDPRLARNRDCAAQCPDPAFHTSSSSRMARPRTMKRHEPVPRHRGATHASHGWPWLATPGLRTAGTAQRNVPRRRRARRCLSAKHCFARRASSGQKPRFCSQPRWAGQEPGSGVSS